MGMCHVHGLMSYVAVYFHGVRICMWCLSLRRETNRRTSSPIVLLYKYLGDGYMRYLHA